MAGLYYVDYIFLLSHYSPGSHRPYNMYYNLYTSSDGIDWLEVHHRGTLRDDPDPSEHSASIIIDDVVGYVRFEVSERSDRWAHLNEMEIWGNPAPIPKPSTLLLLASGLTGLVVSRKKFNKK